MVRGLHSGLLPVAVTCTKDCWEGSRTAEVQIPSRADELLSLSTRSGLGPSVAPNSPSPPLCIAGSLGSKSPKSQNGRKVSGAAAWGVVGARAVHSLEPAQLPSLSLCCVVGKVEEPVPALPARGRVCCVPRGLNLKRPHPA